MKHAYCWGHDDVEHTAILQWNVQPLVDQYSQYFIHEGLLGSIAETATVDTFWLGGLVPISTSGVAFVVVCSCGPFDRQEARLELV